MTFSTRDHDTLVKCSIGPSRITLHKRKHVQDITHPANESRAQFTEELEVKIADAWIEFMTHEEVIQHIA